MGRGTEIMRMERRWCAGQGRVPVTFILLAVRIHFTSLSCGGGGGGTGTASPSILLLSESVCACGPGCCGWRRSSAAPRRSRTCRLHPTPVTSSHPPPPAKRCLFERGWGGGGGGGERGRTGGGEKRAFPRAPKRGLFAGASVEKAKSRARGKPRAKSQARAPDARARRRAACCHRFAGGARCRYAVARRR